MLWSYSALVLALATGASAGPLGSSASSQSCALKCPDTAKIGFEPGRTYTYKYMTDVKTHVAGATEEHSSLHVEAIAKIAVLSKCDFTLQLSDVQLKDSQPGDYSDRSETDGAREFQQSLEAQPLRFAYLDGKVEDLCPAPGETNLALNFKRGLLSALQNPMDDLEKAATLVETDVAGKCESEYSMDSKNYEGYKIKKTKDLLSCTDRHGYTGLIMGLPYDTPSNIQSLPLMKSSHECEQELTPAGRFIKTACRETHMFRPFSKQSSGVVTEVEHTLTYQGDVQGLPAFKSKIDRRTDLLYEHEIPEEESHRRRQAARNTLQQICDKMVNDVRPEVPDLFLALVREMQTLDSSALKRFHSEVTGNNKPCANAESFFRDALFMLGTSASMSVVRDLIMDKTIKSTEADIWMTSLAFISKPNRQMIKELKPLLDMNTEQGKEVLGISSLVYRYCQANPKCTEETPVMAVLTKFRNNLNRDCTAKSKEEMNKVILALKAIGNLGEHGAGVGRSVMRCVNNVNIPLDLRVIATQAFRRMNCDFDREQLIYVFMDPSLDSELRINAYLALMQCPSESLLTRVLDVLEKEQVNQVGSFVWTHLTNLKETSDPFKQQIRAMLEKMELKKRFDLDKRKYSRNIEWSTFSKGMNAGAKVESNLIWSGKSMYPRSAMANLTVDMFGNSVNLMDVGGRLEGLEILFDKYLHPERETPPEGTSNKLEALDKKYKVKLPETPKGSYYLRVFGNEIRYDEILDLDPISMKEKFNVFEWLIEKAKEQDYDITKSIMLLDTEMVIPTMTGLPLKLKVEGAATMQLSLKGRLDLRQMMASPRSLDVYGSLKPSAAVQISGDMSVDASYASTGLKMVSRLHTSTAVDGKVKLQDGQIFNFEWNLPKDKMEIITADSKFYIKYRDTQRAQSMITEGRISKQYCTGSMAAKVTGVEFCGEFSMAPLTAPGAPFDPLTGPSELMITVNKKDTHKGYHMEAKFLREKEKTSGQDLTTIARVSLNTPGSKVDRELTFDFTLNRGDKVVKLDLRSPWKKLSLNGDVTWTPALKRFNTRTIIDDDKVYAFTAELKAEQDGAVTKLTPNVELTIPGASTKTIRGSLMYEPWKMIDGDLVIRNIFKTTVSLKGKYSTTVRGRRSIELDLRSPIFEANVKGTTIQARTGMMTSNMDVLYNFPGDKQQKITFRSKVRSRVSNLSTISSTSSIKFTQFPQFNSAVTLEVRKTARNMQGRVNFEFNQKQPQQIKIEFATKDKSTSRVTARKATAKFLYPAKRWVYEVEVDHMHKAGEINHNTKIKYAPRKEIEYKMMMKHNMKNRLSSKADIQLRYPGRDLRYLHEVDEKEPNVYHNSLKLQMEKYENIILNSVYKMGPVHDLSSTLRVLNYKPVSINVNFNQDWRNLKAHADASYDRMRYSADVYHNHKFQKRDFKVAAGFDFAIPQREVKADVKVVKEKGEVTHDVSVLWDAAKDPSQSFSTSGRISLMPKSPSVNLVVKSYPAVSIDIEGKAKMNVDSWANKVGSLESNLVLKTSFKGVENIELAVKADHAKQEQKDYLEISWAPERKITYSGHMIFINGWKEWKQTTAIKTPFESLSTFNRIIEFKLLDESLDLKLVQEMNQKKIQMEISGKAVPNQIELKGVFKSPYKYAQDLSASYSHKAEDKSLETAAMVGWAPGKHIETKLSADYNLKGWSLTSAGELTVKTPFKDYEFSKLSWNHMNKLKVIKSDSELVIGNKQSKFNVNGKINTQAGKKKVQLVATLKTPFEATKDITVTLKHENERNTYENILSSLSLIYGPGHVVELSSEAHFIPGKSMVTKVKFTSPFKGMELVSVDINNYKEGNKYSTHKEVKWALNKKVSWDGELTVNGYEILSHARLITPFEPFERINLVMNNTKINKVWVATANLDLAPKKKISVEGKFQWAYVKLLSLKLETPYKVFHSLMAELQHKGKMRDFQTSLILDNARMGGPVKINVKMDTSDSDNIRGKMSIRSPLKEYNPLKLEVSHKKTGPKEFSSGLAFTYKKNTYDFSSVLTLNSVKDLNSKWILQWNEKKAEIQAIFKVDSAIHGNFALITPYEQLSNLGVTFNHEGELSSFRNDIAVEYNEHKYSGKSELTATGSKVTAKVSANTPLKKYKSISAVLNHDGPWKKFTNNLNVDIAEQSYSSTVEFSIEGYTANGKVDIKTPIKGYRQINAELSHNGEPTSFKSSATFRYPKNKYDANIEFSYTNSKLASKVILKTPIDDFDRIILEMNHDGQLSNFKSGILFRYPKNKYQSELEFKWAKNTLLTNIEVVTPIKNFKKVGMLLSHNGALTDFTNTITLQVARGKYEATSKFALTEPKTEGTLQITSPINKFEKTLVQFSHEGTVKNFKTNAQVEVYQKSLDGVIEVAIGGQGQKAKIEINTPFKKWEKNIISVESEGNLESHKSEVELQVYETPITMSTELAFTSGYKKGLVKVTTPFTGYKVLSVDGSIQGELLNFKSNFRSVISEYISTVLLDFKPLASRIELVTPNENLKTLKASYNVEGTTEDFVGDAEGTWNGKKITATTKWRYINDQINTAFTLTTPFEKISKVSTTLNYDGPEDNHKTALEFVLNGERFSLNGEADVKLDMHKMDTSLQVVNPFWKPFSYSNKFTYNGPITKFTMKSSTELTLDGKKMNQAAELEWNTELSKLALNWWTVSKISPFSASVNINHVGPLSGFRSSGEVKVNEKTFIITADAAGEKERYSVNGNLNINNPFFKAFTVAAKMNHLGPLSSFNNKGELDVNGKKLILETAMDFSADDTSMDGRVMITNPFIKPFTVASKITHKGPLTNFRTTGEVSLNGKKLTVETTWELKDWEYKLDHEMKVVNQLWKPFTVDVKLQHAGSLASFKTTGEVKVNKKKLTVETEWDLKKQEYKLDHETKVVNQLWKPFTLDVKFNHAGPLASIKTTGEVKVNKKKLTIETEWDLVKQKYKLDHEMKVVNQFWKPFTLDVKLNHAGALANFKTTGELKVDEKKLTMETQWDLKKQEYKLDHEIKVVNQLWKPFTIDIELNHAGPLANFKTTGEVKVNEEKVIIETALDLKKEEYKLDHELKVVNQLWKPFTLDTKLNHAGLPANFKTNGEVKVNEKKLTLETEWNLKKQEYKLDHDLKIVNQLWKPITLDVKLNHVGPLSNFKTTGEFKVNEKKLTLETEWNLKKQTYSLVHELKVVNELWKSFTVATKLNHAGPLGSFKTTGEVKVNEKKLTVETEWELKKQEYKLDHEMKVFNQLWKPFTLDVKLNHAGSLANFKTAGEFKLDDKKLTLDTAWDLRKQKYKLDHEMKVVNQLWKPFTLDVKLNHEGPLANFKTTGEVKLDDKKLILDTAWDLRKQKYKLDHEMKVVNQLWKPFTLDVKLNHEGPLANFKTTGEVKVDEKKMIIEIKWDLKKQECKLDHELKVVNQLWKPLNLDLKLNHEGPLVNFKTVGEVKVDEKKLNIELEWDLKKQGYKLDYELNIVNQLWKPFTLDAKLNHAGALASLKSTSEIKVNDRKLALVAEWELIKERHSLDGNLKIVNPFMKPFNIDVKLKHSGPLSGFKTTSQVAVNEKKLAMETELSFNKELYSLEAGTTITNTFIKPVTFAAKLDHSGPLSAFRTNAEVKLNDKKGAVEANFMRETAGSIQGILKVNNAFYKTVDMTATVKHKGNIKDFATDIEAYVNGKKAVVNINFSFKETTALKAGLKLALPFSHPLTFTSEFTYTGPWTDLSSKLDAELNSMAISAVLENKKTASGLSSLFKLDTPFKQVDSLLVRLDHKGSWPEIQTEFEVDYNGRDIITDLSFKKEGDLINAAFRIKTPYTKVKLISTSLTHEWSKKHFRTNAEMTLNRNTISLNAQLSKKKDTVSANIEMNTPFESAQSLTLSFTKAGILKNWRLDGEAGYNGKKISIDTLFNLEENKVLLKGTLTTPFEVIKKAMMQVKHEGQWTNFENSASMILNDKEYAWDSHLRKINNNIIGMASLALPYEAHKNYKVSVSSDRSDKHFESKIELIYNEKKFGTEVLYKYTDDKLEGKVKLETPYDSISPLLASFSHEGNLKEFKTEAALMTPYKHLKDIEVSASHKGAIDNFHSKAKLKYNTIIYQVEATHKKKEGWSGNSNEAAIKVQTPFEKLSSGSISWKHNDASNKVLGEVEIAAASEGRPVKFNANYKYDATSVEHSATVQWGKATNQKLGYELSGSRITRSSSVILDGKLAVQSSAVDFITAANIKSYPNMKITEGSLTTGGETTTLKNIIKLNQPAYSYDLTMTNPRFTKDVHMYLEGTRGSGSAEAKLELEYADQKLNWLGKVADESTPGSVKYTAVSEAKHTPSGLDTSFTSLLQSDANMFQSNMELRYLTAKDLQMKTSALRAKVNKLRKELSLEILTPVKKMEFAGNQDLGAVKGLQRYVGSMTVDSDKLTRVEFVINKPEKKVDLQVLYPEDGRIHIFGKYKDQKSIEAMGYHIKDGIRTNDLSFGLKLREWNLLETKIYIRPSLYTDVKDWMLSLEFPLNMKEIRSAVMSEFSQKWEHLERAVAPLQPVFTAVNRKLNEWYEANFMFLSDIHMAFVNTGEKLKRTLREGFRAYMAAMQRARTMFKETVTKVYAKLEEMKVKITEFKDMLQTRYENLKKTVTMKIQSYSKEAAAYIVNQIEKVKKFFTENATLQNIKQMIMAHTEKLKAQMNMWLEKLSQTPTVQAMKARWNQMLSSPYMVPIKQAYATMLRHYHHMTTAVKAQLKAFIGEFNARPEVQEIKKFWDTVVEKVKDWYIRYNILTTLKNIQENGLMVFKDKAWAILNKRLHLDKNRVLVWDPEGGQVAFQVYVPIYEIRTMKDLLELIPDVRQMDFQVFKDVYTAVKNQASQYMPPKDWNMWDIYYYYKQYTRPSAWIPQLAAKGAIIGNQHYMTFDKKMYEFAGECSYVLARDFVNGDFAVVVNYQKARGKTTKKSVSIISDGVEYQMTKDGVTLNGKQTVLPHKQGDISITRDPTNTILTKGKALTVSCDTAFDQCEIEVSGLYFGRIAGLLGTYSHEQYDDFMTSDKELAKDVKVFARSWSIKNRCRMINTAVVEDVTKADSSCVKLFKDESSPLRPCFKMIDPVPYLRWCANDVTYLAEPGETASCNVARFYIKSCKAAFGVPVKMPAPCGNCKMTDNTMLPIGEELTLTSDNKNVPKSAAIVFVVEHARCNKFLTPSLDKMVQYLDKSLRGVGLTGNTFGLVGYGGSGEYNAPHIHTINGQLMSRSRQFRSGRLPVRSEDQDDFSPDPLAAVRLAASYPFRAGVSKNIILFKCAKCQEQTTLAADVLQDLKAQNIRLNILQPEDFIVASETPVSVIRGLTNTKVFTSQHSNGNEELRSKVSIATDKCTPIAQQTNGVIFDTRRLYQNLRVTKQVANVLNKQLALRAQPEPCQVCKCVTDNYGISKTICYSCQGPVFEVLPQPVLAAAATSESEEDDSIWS